MSMMWTLCNDCGYLNNHVFTNKCIKCGSTNVDAELDTSDWEESRESDEDEEE
jgi:ribosomal protein L37E